MSVRQAEAVSHVQIEQELKTAVCFATATADRDVACLGTSSSALPDLADPTIGLASPAQEPSPAFMAGEQQKGLTGTMEKIEALKKGIQAELTELVELNLDNRDFNSAVQDCFLVLDWRVEEAESQMPQRTNEKQKETREGNRGRANLEKAAQKSLRVKASLRDLAANQAMVCQLLSQGRRLSQANADALHRIGADVQRRSLALGSILVQSLEEEARPSGRFAEHTVAGRFSCAANQVSALSLGMRHSLQNRLSTRLPRFMSRISGKMSAH